jgi:hypothetical protein
MLKIKPRRSFQQLCDSLEKPVRRPIRSPVIGIPASRYGEKMAETPA